MIRLIFFMLLALSPELAFSANVFDPVSGDTAMLVLQSVFGQLGMFGSGGSDPFVVPLSIFNGAVLTIGGILAAYTILAGTLGTAHDGEMLGKKFSSVWIPIRYSLGTALVLPIVGGGYCLMQVIVGWLVVQGIGLADAVWTSYTSNANLVQVATASLSPPEAKQLGYNLFQSLVCMDVLKQVTSAQHDLLFGNSDIGVTKEDTSTATTYYFGDKNETSQFSRDSCGKLTVPKIFAANATMSGDGSGLFSSGEVESLVDPITTAHQTATATLMSALQPQADALVNGGVPINPAPIDAAIAAYEATIKQAAAQAVLSTDAYKELSKNASQNGFFLAGAWQMKLAALIDAVQKKIGNVPTSSGPTDMMAEVAKDRFGPVLIILAKTMQASQAGQAQFGVGNEAGGSNTTWWSTFKQAVGGGSLDITLLLKKQYTSSGSVVIASTGDPVINLKLLGNYVQGVAGGGLVATGIASATIGNAPGIGAFINSTMLLILPPMLLAGFACSYIVPMTPLFIWIGTIVGWVVLVVEAIVAAPLWAVMHLHPHGDDLTGGGTNGYRLVLALLLRPVLMTFGLMASITLTQVFGNLLARTYADMFLLSQGDSGFLTWVVGALIASPLIYAGLMFVLVKKMFSLVHVIPDQLLNWIGGGGPQLGHYSDDIGGNNVFAAAGVFPRIGGQAVEAMSGRSLANPNAGAGGNGAAGGNPLNRLLNKGNSPNGQGAASAEAAFIGASAESILEKAAGAGKGSKSGLEAVKNRTSLTEAMTRFGGPNTSDTNKLLDRISESQNSPDPARQSYTFDQHVASAVRKGLDDNFGAGAGNAAAKVGGGFSGPAFNRAVDTYRDTASKLSAIGMSETEVTRALSGATAKARAAFEKEQAAGGSTPFKEYFANEMNKVVPKDKK
ncbi:integral membrane protein [Caballeronia peredens]|nr:integral membrane protein [Caballeronia peredens]